MYQITELTDQPKQQVKVTVGANKTCKLNFTYCPNQQCWFFDIIYDDGNFYSYGHKLTNCPNIIRQFQNTLPFGLGCSVEDGLEPWFQNDFITERVKVYVLSKEDVQTIGTDLYAKIW